MEKRVVFVGEEFIVSEETRYLAFDSSESLLDGDLIVFSIETSSYATDIHSSEGYFRGLRCLTDNASFRLRENINHWRSEITAALEDGKTVVFMLNESPQLAVGTGETRYQGSGRSARKIRVVDTFDPYQVIPTAFGSVVRRSGERIRAVADLGILATYWHEFGACSTYESYIEGFTGVKLLETQTGGKVVGGLLKHPSWKGTLLLIPRPNLDAEIDARTASLKAKKKVQASKASNSATKAEESYRKKAGRSLANQFFSALIALDKAVRSATETTPAPVWSSEDRFLLKREQNLQAEVERNIEQTQKLVGERRILEKKLNEAQEIKGLLYEKGKPLERAILLALRRLGFAAENLQEADSEFDAVFLDPDGTRFIGEAEGKDDKAINVDKLDQLDRNLREDFSRQDDSAALFAKGILFGNAFRLTPPESREPFFTAKCLLAAKRSRIALLRTTDLFVITKYLEDHPDEQFTKACRQAIATTDGEIVAFPKPPEL
jgi:hypothetical protein